MDNLGQNVWLAFLLMLAFAASLIFNHWVVKLVGFVVAVGALSILLLNLKANLAVTMFLLTAMLVVQAISCLKVKNSKPNRFIGIVLAFLAFVAVMTGIGALDAGDELGAVGLSVGSAFLQGFVVMGELLGQLVRGGS